ncbi:RrF2 family transcriptional regulator [Facilibium subflavum]|uniref:RrF2 family transcriptional regulator n=1 Tax=Facilibium subflavum TaxID=2219058 RepID=UPI000E65DE47|nr:Rrf2 family transcriptional regulator [Facilibium subflavum]
MQLTTFTDYSLRVLIYLGLHNTRLCTSKEIATFHHISLNHIVKVVHNLSKYGFIESIKGKNGGIKLALAPDKINLGQTIRQLEPNFYIAECFNQEKSSCALLPACKLKGMLGQALSAFFNELDQYTLADVL